VSNLHGDEDDDDDYLVSNSYVEKSLDKDDSIDDISDTDDEVTDMIQPVRIVHPAQGIISSKKIREYIYHLMKIVFNAK